MYRLNYDDKPKKPRAMAPAFVETDLLASCEPALAALKGDTVWEGEEEEEDGDELV